MLNSVKLLSKMMVNNMIEDYVDAKVIVVLFTKK